MSPVPVLLRAVQWSQQAINRTWLLLQLHRGRGHAGRAGQASHHPVGSRQACASSTLPLQSRAFTLVIWSRFAGLLAQGRPKCFTLSLPLQLRPLQRGAARACVILSLGLVLTTRELRCLFVGYARKLRYRKCPPLGSLRMRNEAWRVEEAMGRLLVYRANDTKTLYVTLHSLLAFFSTREGSFGMFS